MSTTWTGTPAPLPCVNSCCKVQVPENILRVLRCDSVDPKSEGHESIGGAVWWQGESGVRDEFEANESVLVPEIPGIPWLTDYARTNHNYSIIFAPMRYISRFSFLELSNYNASIWYFPLRCFSLISAAFH